MREKILNDKHATVSITAKTGGEGLNFEAKRAFCHENKILESTRIWLYS